MTKLTITEPDPDENGPGLILTAEGQRSELITAGHALTRAALRVRTLLVQYHPTYATALDRALADLDAQRAVIAELLAAEVPE